MPTFASIKEKIAESERINDEDALFLFQSHDLISIGELANFVNQRKHGKVVFYNINAHINPTNICVMSCKFCSFSRKPGDEGSYAYSIEEILAKAKKADEFGATEVHMVGGLHPRWNLDYFLTMISSVKKQFPHIHIKAFTAVEIDWLARKSRQSHKDVLLALKHAGLGSMPGGGAEIFHPDIREVITAKLSSEDWLHIHRTAHQLGLKSNATMLYGHVESYEHRIYHLKQLRQLQDETQGFQCFIPLSFQPHNNEMGINHYTYGAQDLKVLALARIYLDNFAHIKSYWVMMGQDIAQMGLSFGGNDMDGTVHDEKISHMAGGRSGIGMLKNNIKELIRKSGHIPQERDTLYNHVYRDHERRSPVDLETTSLDSLNALLSHPKEAWTASQLGLGLGKASIFHLGQKIQEMRDPFQASQANYSLVRECDGLESLLAESETPHTLLLDLYTSKATSFAQLLSSLEQLKQRKVMPNLVLSGLSTLWGMMQAQKAALPEAMRSLAQFSLVLESSYFEEEHNLTHREISEFHHAAHKQGISTIAKVELSSPLVENSTPLWENYMDRLLVFRDLQENSRGLLSLMVTVSKDSFISAHEFLKAVAIARLVCPEIPHLTAPFRIMPALNPKEGRLAHQPLFYGQEKIAPLALIMGADDFGHLPYNRIELSGFKDEIESVGFTPKARDHRFST